MMEHFLDTYMYICSCGREETYDCDALPDGWTMDYETDGLGDEWEVYTCPGCNAEMRDLYLPESKESAK